ncbi:MAG: DUF2911 domain-containing protein [Ignavibacteriae bacterium]|nr:DUF2911 domain-containing protein [Ignavibacteriota bacterium]
MNKYIRFVLVLCCTILALDGASAQQAYSPTLPVLRSPRTSQGAKITQMVGLSDVTLYYHRPGVKGRTIFGPKSSGALQPYGDVWRVGANEPTLFSFSHDVTIAGKRLRAGMYRFVAIPGEKEWTLVFNSEVDNWGTVYDQSYDTLRFTAKPETIPNVEWETFYFDELTPTTARVVLEWEKVRVAFNVEFNLLPLLQASVGRWQELSNAARFAADNKLYLKEAMEWVNRSIALNKSFFNLRTKAELLAFEGKYKEAVEAGEEGLKIIRASGVDKLPDFQKVMVTATENMVTEWKDKTGTK